VGQQVSFGTSWGTLPPNIVDTVQHWVISGDYVNEPYAYSATCNSYRKNSDLQTNMTTGCWFVNGSSGSAGIAMNLHMSNGQYVNVAANGNFNIYRPSVSVIVEANVEPSFYCSNSFNFYNIVSLGGNGDPRQDGYQHDMEYYAVYSVGPFSGQAGITQLIQASYSPSPASQSYSFSDWRLDGDAEYYDTPQEIDAVNEENYFLPPITHAVFFHDSPEAGYYGPVTCKASFKDYCRFKPDGDDSIFVTLGIINWSCDGECTTGGILTVNSVTGPLGPDTSDTFPAWQYVLHGGDHQ